MFNATGTRNHEDGQRISLTDYARFLDVLPTAACICDTQGVLIAYNDVAAALWGYRPATGKDRWYGTSKPYLINGAPQSEEHSALMEAIHTGKRAGPCEVVMQRPDGGGMPVLQYAQPVFDQDRAVAGALCLLVDRSAPSRVTSEQLLNMEIEARNNEDRYRRMVSEIEDYAIILLSPTGIVELWNKGAEKIEGYREAEIVGKSFSVFYPVEDVANGLPESLMRRAAEEGKANYEGWRVRKDGSRFWGSVSMTALHNEKGNVSGFSMVTRDLTERRESEIRIEKYNEDLREKNELLRQSEDRYHRMVSEVEDYVIILLSVDGIIQNWNKGAQKIKGYSAEEVIGRHFSIFYTQEDREKGLPEWIIAEAASRGKALHDGWRVRKDGSVFWGSVVLTALHNDDGKLVGFTKVTRDLTDKKLTEERLKMTSDKLEVQNRELERMNEDLSSFAYISSHDLQEPLRKIQTFSDRIMELEYNNLSEKGKDYLQRMQRGAQRMQKLIRDILTYSRTTTADRNLEQTDLNEILNQSRNELEMQIHEKGVIVDSDRLPTLKVIPVQVQQLFNNLLNNAVKFSRPDTRPHVRIAAEIADAHAFKLDLPLPAEKYCHISFTDNGIGFDPVYEKKIFEVFQRLHGRSEYGGTGIGLAICKKIVDNHHGILRADSVPGEGSTFHVYLPVVQ